MVPPGGPDYSGHPTSPRPPCRLASSPRFGLARLVTPGFPEVKGINWTLGTHSAFLGQVVGVSVVLSHEGDPSFPQAQAWRTPGAGLTSSAEVPADVAGKLCRWLPVGTRSPSQCGPRQLLAAEMKAVCQPRLQPFDSENPREAYRGAPLRCVWRGGLSLGDREERRGPEGEV